MDRTNSTHDASGFVTRMLLRGNERIAAGIRDESRQTDGEFVAAVGVIEIGRWSLRARKKKTSRDAAVASHRRNPAVTLFMNRQAFASRLLVLLT